MFSFDAIEGSPSPNTSNGNNSPTLMIQNAAPTTLAREDGEIISMSDLLPRLAVFVW